MIVFRVKKDKQRFDLKKTLIKQLRILSERSEAADSDIASLTHAMCELTSAICEMLKTADEYCGD